MVVSKGVMHDLFELIARPLERGNGFRHLFLGDSGMGKTVANTQFVDWLRATKRVDLILTLDDKDSFAASYIGCERVNPADLRANPPMPNEVRSHIVFRGVAMTRKIGQGCNPDELARLAWEIATHSKSRTVINIDELADATNGLHHSDHAIATNSPSRGIRAKRDHLSLPHVRQGGRVPHVKEGYNERGRRHHPNPAGRVVPSVR